LWVPVQTDRLPPTTRADSAKPARVVPASSVRVAAAASACAFIPWMARIPGRRTATASARALPRLRQYCQPPSAAPMPVLSVWVIPFINAAQSPNAAPAAAARTAVWTAPAAGRLAPRLGLSPAGPRRPHTASPPTTTRFTPMPASSPASPAVIAAADAHSRHPIRCRNTRDAKISACAVSGGSRRAAAPRMLRSRPPRAPRGSS
jgi:hypothetical protein